MARDERARRVPECTGACCDPVKIPVAAWVKLHLEPEKVGDAEILRDMLIEAPPTERILELAALERLTQVQGGAPNSVTLHLRCRHFDQVSRRCGIYDQRPGMCSAFPYGEPCEFCGGVGEPLEGEGGP